MIHFDQPKYPAGQRTAQMLKDAFTAAHPDLDSESDDYRDGMADMLAWICQHGQSLTIDSIFNSVVELRMWVDRERWL